MTKPVKDRIWGSVGVPAYRVAQLPNDVADGPSGLDSSKVCLNMQVSEDHSNLGTSGTSPSNKGIGSFCTRQSASCPIGVVISRYDAKHEGLGSSRDEYVVQSVQSCTCSFENTAVKTSGSAEWQIFSTNVRCVLIRY